MTYKAEIDRGIELLKECLKLKSEQDGIDRAELFSIDKTKTRDQFARDIENTAMRLASLNTAIPVMNSLHILARRLESDGKITVEAGGNYAVIALNYIMKQNGFDEDTWER